MLVSGLLLHTASPVGLTNNNLTKYYVMRLLIVSATKGLFTRTVWISSPEADI